MTLLFNYEVELELNESELQSFLDFSVQKLIDQDVKINDRLELVLAFVSEQKSRQLNNQFRNKDKSTDVLSFQSDDPEALGELILCHNVIEAQAKKNNWSLQHEYSYMILHGLLHLLGFDHETDDKAAKEMYGLQDKIFFEYFPGVK